MKEMPKQERTAAKPQVQVWAAAEPQEDPQAAVELQKILQVVAEP